MLNKESTIKEIEILSNEINMRTSHMQNTVIAVSWAAIAVIFSLNFNEVIQSSIPIKNLLFFSILSFSNALIFAYWENSINRDYANSQIIVKKYMIMCSECSPQDIEQKKELINALDKAICKMNSKLNFRLREAYMVLKSFCFVSGIILLSATTYTVLFCKANQSDQNIQTERIDQMAK